MKKLTKETVDTSFDILDDTEQVNIGGFPFNKEGCLLVSELKWFQKESDKRMNAVLPVLTLAKKISEVEQVSEDDALLLVQNLGSPENSIYALKYFDDLKLIKDNQYTEDDSMFAACLMMLNSRVSKSFLRENLERLNDKYDANLEATKPVFTSIDSFPEKLLDQIYSFVLSEKNKGVLDIEVEQVESLGK